ncbi:hypothetical protein BGZ46_010731 [Entomortierella lignicola]|nr:hypothetical protein BGZ46_010731 [Entomortierella lignicola]
MRSNAIRSVLGSPRISVVSSTTSFRNEHSKLQLHANKITVADSFWQSCFQRAYSRSILSKNHRSLIHSSRQTRSSPQRITTTTTTTTQCLAREQQSSIRKHSRPYSNAATATVSTSTPKTSTAHHPTTLPLTDPVVSETKKPRKAEVIIKELDQAIRNEDLKSAYSTYYSIRRWELPPDLARLWFKCQYRLVQLFHRTQLEVLHNDQANVFTKKLKQLEQNRWVVLTDISRRTLRGNSHAKSLASLVEALGKSKAIVHHSYQTNSKTKLNDWREALTILEDWSTLWQSRFGKVSVCGHVVEKDSKRASSAEEINLIDSSPSPPPIPTPTPTLSHPQESKFLERELTGWLKKLMKSLVYSHTFLIRSMLDTIPSQFGVQATIDMYIILLEYYSKFGKEGSKDTLEIISKMSNQNIAWKQEPVVYDYILYALSNDSRNIVQADQIIERMLANDLVPREETMKAAILCAARSGDMKACSRYIQRMHRDWNITITERMKAILLYACAKRGDFEGTLEILGQLSGAGTLVHSKLGNAKTHHHHHHHHRAKDNDPVSSTTFTSNMEEILGSQDIINNSNILLSLINQTNLRRSNNNNNKQASQESIKEEVSKVLELFTVITKDRNQVDTQLYTIMMQYLSSLPSPLPGMMFLYREMCTLENAKPNHVTFKIMLEACAEQMDMDQAKQLWKDMSMTNIIKDCHIRASYVKGWGRTGHLDTAEKIAKAALLAQEQLDRERMQHHVVFAIKNKKRRAQGLPILETPPRLPRRQRVSEMINLTVLHELMRAHRQHNKPGRVYELYKEIEAGKWGKRIRPNGFTLSIVLGACASGTTAPELVDQSIKLVDHVLNTKRRQRMQEFMDNDDDDDDDDESRTEGERKEDNDDDDDSRHQPRRQPRRRILELLGSESAPDKSQLPILSEVNYQLYFTMLGRHHRQEKMVEVWEDMMGSIDESRPPSRLTVNLVTEALENVQWGARPIKRIQRQLREHWPQVDWENLNRGHSIGSGGHKIEVDESVGAGGRFWK